MGLRRGPPVGWAELYRGRHEIGGTLFASNVALRRRRGCNPAATRGATGGKPSGETIVFPRSRSQLMRMRRTAVAVALAAAVTVPAVSTAVAAFAQPTSAAAHSKPGEPAKPAKKNFSASGTVTAVSAGDGHVTVAAKGGTKD